MGLQRLEKQTAFSFVRNLLSIYYERRNLNELTDYMQEQISWSGTGEEKLCENFD